MKMTRIKEALSLPATTSSILFSKISIFREITKGENKHLVNFYKISYTKSFIAHIALQFIVNHSFNVILINLFLGPI